MAFYGCFSTSFFNIILSFGTNCLVNLQRHGKFLKLPIFKFNLINDFLLLYLIIFTLGLCLYLIIYLYINSFTVTKKMILPLVIIYSTFSIGLISYHGYLLRSRSDFYY